MDPLSQILYASIFVVAIVGFVWMVWRKISSIKI